jgi:ribose 5-phosphate isomerase B
MNISIASDHAGFAMKQSLARWLAEQGHAVNDCGPADDKRVDYPDFAAKAGELVRQGKTERAVLVCGSGIGMAMSANKIPGCRAAVLHSEWEAEMSRRHNDANVACFGARSMGPDLVQSCLKVFLATGFDGGRHAERVAKISTLDGSKPH